MDHLIFCAGNSFCPGKEAALVSIVVSLSCTAYQCGSFIVLCKKSESEFTGLKEFTEF